MKKSLLFFNSDSTFRPILLTLTKLIATHF
nr:MAG TPA: hypothetical protein [Caudoviricetes sp.]